MPRGEARTAARFCHVQALAHPYLGSLHDSSDEPLAHASFSFEFEKMALDAQMLKQLIAKEEQLMESAACPV